MTELTVKVHIADIEEVKALVESATKFFKEIKPSKFEDGPELLAYVNLRSALSGLVIIDVDRGGEWGGEMTNYELIKNMSIEEMAVTLVCPNEMGMADIDCDRSSRDCCQCALKWLREEVKDVESERG